MGKAWAPAVASIYLSEWERAVFERARIKPILYKRYIDDVLCIVSSREEADLLVCSMNEADVNMRLGEFTTGEVVNFLDTRIYTIYSPRFILNRPIYDCYCITIGRKHLR